MTEQEIVERERAARKLIASINAYPVIQCAETGDFVANRADRHPQQEGGKAGVHYWYVPANATTVSELVEVEVSELGDGFFKRPINPFTWEKIIPVNPKK